MVKVVDKLVRDKVIELKKTDGEKVTYHVADDEEYQLRLKEKVLEEAKDFHSSGNIEELADLVEAVDLLLDAHGFNMDILEKIREHKKKHEGTFEKKFVLDTVDE